MLPQKLSSGICSLNPGVDRLVFSVLMEIDPKGRVVEARFVNGVLRSRARMTYTSVAKILSEHDRSTTMQYAALVPLFEIMQELCLILSDKRHRRGSIDFDLPEAEIRFSENGAISSVLPAERNIAHRIIEEFMLAANECVAQKLAMSRGPALYRVHEKPDPEKVEEFAQFASSLGYKLHRPGKEYRAKDFQKFIAQLEGKPEQRFLAYLMLRSFMQARYSDRNLGHFGLASSAYTHFTSPIRRYPDLVVHRLLKECLKDEPSASWRAEIARRLPEIALHTSNREQIAEEAEREIERIKKAQFMADKIGELFEAIVLSVLPQGFWVELLLHYVEGFVPVNTLIDDKYHYDERTRALIGERKKRRFQLGSRIQVRLDSVNVETGRLTFSVTSAGYRGAANTSARLSSGLQ